MTKQTPYQRAVRWIAFNDDQDCRDVETLSYQITVALIADVFGKDPLDVAQAILYVRARGVEAA
jgi:hypothetical protein